MSQTLLQPYLQFFIQTPYYSTFMFNMHQNLKSIILASENTMIKKQYIHNNNSIKFFLSSSLRTNPNLILLLKNY